ncbi:MAG: hypothetical protein KGY54_10210 [Oleiphilaceae bacterium]|nr:hypothetical protein [Oleiphilaceae bacterium]
MRFMSPVGCATSLLVSVLVAGCGFHLRGSAPVPTALEPLAVRCSEDVPENLCRAMTQQLKQGGVTVVERDVAAYVLQVENFNERRRASAITQQGSASEFDLRQSVNLTVVTDDQLPLVADTEVSASETYRYDEANVLAKRREEESVRETLYQRLAQQVIFRLAPLTRERIDSLRQAAEQEKAEQAAEEADDNDGGAEE